MTWVAVGVGAMGLIGGAMQSSAAKKAAAAQQQAAMAQIAEQRRQYDQTRADQLPFMETGTAGNARLAKLLGIDKGGTGSGELLRKFGASDLEADPVYQSGLQFGLDEGTKGINARAISSGMYDSGATLKALTKYGNDYGSTKANESYNRYTADQNNIYNKLAGVSGAGQVASGQIQAAGTNMANNVSSAIADAGNARAAGIVGGANAWAGGLSNAYNNYQNNSILQKLLKQQGTGGGGYGSIYSPQNDPDNLMMGRN